MLKTLIVRLWVSLTLLLTSCSVPDWASESYNLPKAAYAISFLVAKSGELRQLNYQLQAPPESMANIIYMDKELTSAGFTRCDSGDTWFFLGEKDQSEKKGTVRFYRGPDKYRMATLGVDQICSSNTNCTQATVLVFGSHPWWMFNRESVIKKICGVSE